MGPTLHRAAVGKIKCYQRQTRYLPMYRGPQDRLARTQNRTLRYRRHGKLPQETQLFSAGLHMDAQYLHIYAFHISCIQCDACEAVQLACGDRASVRLLLQHSPPVVSGSLPFAAPGLDSEPCCERETLIGQELGQERGLAVLSQGLSAVSFQPTPPELAIARI